MNDVKIPSIMWEDITSYFLDDAALTKVERDTLKYRIICGIREKQKRVEQRENYMRRKGIFKY